MSLLLRSRLTNHLGGMLDPSRISPTASHFHDLHSYDKSKSSQSISTPSTLLPSFASLQEHTNRSEDGDGPEIASMSSRLSCYHCTKFKPLVQDITTAVAELEETVQALCGASAASAGVSCIDRSEHLCTSCRMLTDCRTLTDSAIARFEPHNGFLKDCIMLSTIFVKRPSAIRAATQITHSRINLLTYFRILLIIP